MTLKPIAISKRGRSITKADKDPTNDEDGDQEPSAKRQKTSGADASTLSLACSDATRKRKNSQCSGGNPYWPMDIAKAKRTLRHGEAA